MKKEYINPDLNIFVYSLDALMTSGITINETIDSEDSFDNSKSWGFGG